MMSSTDRNEKVKIYITEKLNKAETSSERDFESLSNYHEISKTLNDLIIVNAKGFRGIVATALAGLFLDSSYDPLNNFYACNPRSIFENGIFFAFENRVPCGKSDPLNVAKNQNELNVSWARGKRPESAALAVVNYLTAVVNNPDEQELLIDFYFYRLAEYSKSVKSFKIIAPSHNSLSHQERGHRLAKFTYEYPESGTIPQFVVSLLLKALYHHSSLNVIGGNESVFGTNTTSKKPADIWVEANGNPINLYEITVKKIDHKRLNDSISALHNLNMLDVNIHFICHIPEDITSLKNIVEGTYNYNGKLFNFIDLKTFILTLASLLTSNQLQNIIDELALFVTNIKRPLSTKEGWNNIFEIH